MPSKFWNIYYWRRYEQRAVDNPLRSNIYDAAGRNFPDEASGYARLDRVVGDNRGAYIRWNPELPADAYDNKIIFDLLPAPWRERETRRFAVGEYERPVWARERFWQDALHQQAFKDHHAHISTDDPIMLAYTPSDEYGERDRQVRCKPGKYLTKFFGASEKTGKIADGPYKGRDPILDKKKIAYYAEWWEKGSKPSKYEHLELVFYSTPEDIATAYIKGPDSCMGGRYFRSTKDHPASAYGAGDLQLACLLDTASGRVMARAIAWPEREGFGRVYPTPDYWSYDKFEGPEDSQDCQNALRQRLKAMGWTDILEDRRVLDGARILKIVDPNEGEPYYRCAYLDNDLGLVADEGDEFFRLQYDASHRPTSGGQVRVAPTFVCEKTGNRYETHSSRGRDQRVTVFTAWDKESGCGAEPQTWYVDNATDYAYQSSHDSQWYRNGISAVNLHGGSRMVMAVAKAQGYGKCHWSGSWFPADELVKIDGHTYGRASLRNVAFHCRYDGQDYPFSEMSTVWCGFPAKYDDADIDVTERYRCNPMIRTQMWDQDVFDWRDTEVWPYDQHTAIEVFALKHRLAQVEARVAQAA